VIVSNSFFIWRYEDFLRGRDPDTPGDAVYRTTRFENPFITDPLMRAYGIGGVEPVPGVRMPPMLAGDQWLQPDNDFTGQHARRPVEENTACLAPPPETVAVCAAASWMSDYWASRRP
jgi:hypothetical protein